jgi:hypothetical protein
MAGRRAEESCLKKTTSVKKATKQGNFGFLIYIKLPSFVPR